MTKQELNAIEARASAATEGPWDVLPCVGQRTASGIFERHGNDVVSGSDKNRNFIAHARQDIPALLATVRKLMVLKDKHKERARFLECLEAAGVDSWEGYEQAQEAFGDD